MYPLYLKIKNKTENDYMPDFIIIMALIHFRQQKQTDTT